MLNALGVLGAIMGRCQVGPVVGNPIDAARRLGWTAGVGMLTRAAVGTNEVGISVDSGTGVELNGTVEQMRSTSFAVMAAGLAPSYPLYSGLLQVDEVSPTAGEVDEMEPAPVDKVPYGIVRLAPSKVVYVTALSAELLRSPQAVDVIQRRAIDAVSRGLDQALISRLPSSAGSLSAGADALGDVRELVGLINVTGAQPIVFGMAADVALRAATLKQGCLIFPGAVATGRSEIAGLPAMATDRVPAGQMIALDASGVAINVQAIEVMVSKNGSIFASDVGGSGVQQLVSLFQSGAIGLRVTCRFGMAVIRQSDVCGVLADIAWANS